MLKKIGKLWNITNYQMSRAIQLKNELLHLTMIQPLLSIKKLLDYIIVAFYSIDDEGIIF